MAASMPKYLLGSRDWDPFHHANSVPTPQCLLRIKKDIKALYDDSPPNIHVVPDEKNYTLIHALITGSFGTPYKGGFFYFILRIPSNYPMSPPWVKNMTTGGGTVRFNPNLYKNGKVCLSILGTWSGPPWSPANTLESCLMSIQSLLGETPYHNEPGYEKERVKGDAQRYNDVIQHETLRVAVCGAIDNDSRIVMPQALVQVMDKNFLEYYDTYKSIAKKNMHMNNKTMLDPFGENRGVYRYDTILKRLKECKKKVLARYSASNDKKLGSKTENSSSSFDCEDELSWSDLSLDNDNDDDDEEEEEEEAGDNSEVMEVTKDDIKTKDVN